MTDERQGDLLWSALQRLPRGAGIVFRHKSLAPAERRHLFERVRRICRRKRILLVLAGDALIARAWKADGHHGRDARRKVGFRSCPVHSLRELRAAERAGADLLFLSPVFPTRSHTDAPTLGRVGFAALARLTDRRVVALGGMDARKARALPGAFGWAAIDAWSQPAQKRIAVPR
jgi:thiamine-phosphate pyrophosphorylase